MKIKRYLFGVLMLCFLMLPLNTEAEIAETTKSAIDESPLQKTEIPEVTKIEETAPAQNGDTSNKETETTKEDDIVETQDPASKIEETKDDEVTNVGAGHAQPTTKSQTDQPNQPTTSSEKIIINEIMIGSEINNIKDVWIEFYNPGSEEVKLDKWKIKGVTKGGSWIDIVNKSDLTIKPDGYFLFSYYSNSSSSALDIKPDMQKSSLLFPSNAIEIQIKDPNENIIDTAKIEHEIGEKFQSHERNLPIADGKLSTSWSLSTKQINLKKDLKITFATPGSKNSLYIKDISNVETQDPASKTEDTKKDETVETQDVVSKKDEDDKPIATDDVATNQSNQTTTENTTTESQPPKTSTPPPTPPVSPSGGSSTPTKIIYPTYQLINEFMVNPKGSDTEGEWIELFNNTSDSIDLNDWYLDDADGSSSPFKIGNVSINPKSYLIFSEPNLKLSLKNDSDQVRLLDPNKEAKEIITYFDAKEDYTYAKQSNGEFKWTSIITPNAENQFPAPLKSYMTDDVIFKSVLPNPKGTDEGHEKIILKNNLNEVVKMDNWKIKNKNGTEYPMKGVQLNISQTLTLDPAQIKLTLTNTSDQLSLVDPKGNLIDRINWSKAVDDQIIYRSDYFQNGTKTKVEKVIDGDTFTTTINNTKFNIRLIGVDTPETVDPKKPVQKFGKEATDYLNNLILDKVVTLTFDDIKTDSYNRPLAYVYLDGQFINAEIIKDGYGHAYIDYAFKYQDNFVKYEKEAKEKGLGLWANDVDVETQDPASKKEKEGTKDNNVETQDLASMKKNDESDIPNIETQSLTSIEEKDKSDLKDRDSSGRVGMTEWLKIDSIIPNASMEHIRLINNGKETVYLKGWKLDDAIGSGSKSFEIKGGAIEAGAMRTFRKTETKIILNNSNECAHLINPSGTVVDKICYAKTHTDEIFTHEGGDWISTKKTSTTKQSTTTKNSTTSSRSSDNYKWDLKNETLNGKIDYIYEKGEVIYLKANDKIIPVSYAGSKININMVKQLVDIKEPVLLDVRSTPESKNLIGLKQAVNTNKPDLQKKPFSMSIIYGVVLLMVFGGLFLGRKRLFKSL